MTKEEWKLSEVGLGEGSSEASSRTSSLGNGGKIVMEVKFEGKGEKGGKMD